MQATKVSLLWKRNEPTLAETKGNQPPLNMLGSRNNCRKDRCVVGVVFFFMKKLWICLSAQMRSRENQYNKESVAWKKVALWIPSSPPTSTFPLIKPSFSPALALKIIIKQPNLGFLFSLIKIITHPAGRGSEIEHRWT